MSSGSLIVHVQNRCIRRFREAGALSADRARPLAEIGEREHFPLRRLRAAGVIREDGDGRFYLDEEPILKNVPTWRCEAEDDCAYVLEHLPELVVKEVHGSGGYGMLVGPAASKREREEFAARIKANPCNYIAQPTLALSTCPTFVENGIAPRHVDFRPFVLSGKNVRIVKGGLTRVALRSGSLVVNSSQGGGTKDTWVLSQ